MEPLARLDSTSILDEKIFLEIFDQEDEITKARMILSLTDRATELGVKKKFEELLKAYKRVDMRQNRESERNRLPCWISGPILKDHMTTCFAGHGLPEKTAYMHRMTVRWTQLPVITQFCQWSE